MPRRHPDMVTERKRPSPWDDCTLCSGAMATDAATGGRITPTRKEVRDASGVTDHVGLSDGTNLSDLARALDKLAPALIVKRPQSGDFLTTPQFFVAIKGNVVAVTCGNYSELPEHFTRWDPPFGRNPKAWHATFTMWDGDGYWWMDPLAPDAYQGEYIPEQALAKYINGMRYNAAGARYIGIIPAIVELDPPVVPAPPPEDHEVKFILAEGYGVDQLPLRIVAPKGTEIRELDSDVPWTALKSEAILITSGLADGHSGDFFVIVSTGRFAPDTERRDYWQRARIPGGKPRPKLPTDPR